MSVEFDIISGADVFVVASGRVAGAGIAPFAGIVLLVIASGRVADELGVVWSSAAAEESPAASTASTNISDFTPAECAVWTA